jgi:hypothetical protein
MGARNRVGIGLSYRPARLHRLTELVPWNRLLKIRVLDSIVYFVMRKLAPSFRKVSVDREMR